MNDKNINRPLLSIIIVNWNSGSVLIDCLKSIYRTVKIPVEIIVVDNNSSDESVPMVKRDFPDVKLLEEKENLGYSKGNNLGVKHSIGEYILILNPDTILFDGAVTKMLNFLETHEKAGIVGPKILKSDRSIAFNSKRRLPTLYEDFSIIFLLQKIPDIIKTKLSKWQFLKKNLFNYYAKTEECECLQGCCILIRRDVFKLLGGFDESVPMYLDDIDLFYRCRKAGFKNFYISDAKIFHLEKYSTKKSESHKLYDALCLEARLFYYKKNFGEAKALAFRIGLLFSVPYLLIIDIISIPYFLVRNKLSDRSWVFKKHMKFFELALTGKIRWGKEKAL